MRLVLRGHFPVEEAKSTIADFLDGLVADEVDVVSGVSLYFSPYSEGRSVTIYNEAGMRIEEIEVRNVGKSVFGSSLVSSMNRDDGASDDPEELALRAEFEQIRQKWREASDRRYAARAAKKNPESD